MHGRPDRSTRLSANAYIGHPKHAATCHPTPLRCAENEPRSRTSRPRPACRWPRSAGRCEGCRTSPAPPASGSRRSPTELNYRADPAASRLAAGRSRAIAVAVPLLDGWYFSHVVAGVEAVFAEAGYDTIIVGIGAHGEGRHVLEVAGPIYRRVDGLICVDVSLTDDELCRLQNERMAIVYVGHDNDGDPVPRHRRRRGRPAGHAAPARPRPPADRHDQRPARRRARLRRAAQAPAGLRAGVPRGRARRPTRTLYVPGYFTIEGGYQALNTLLDRDRSADRCVLVLRRDGVRGAVGRARPRASRCPSDLSLVGVDDHDVSPARAAHHRAPGRRRARRPCGADR